MSRFTALSFTLSAALLQAAGDNSRWFVAVELNRNEAEGFSGDAAAGLLLDGWL